MHRFVGVLGMLTMMGLAWLFSTDRKAINKKTVAWGLALQIAFAFIVMRWEYGRADFSKGRRRRQVAPRFRFLWFVVRIRRTGQTKARRRDSSSHSKCCRRSFSSRQCSLLLYHWGIMQQIIRLAAWVMTRLMGASGAESLNVAASIFMGQTEAPLTIRPFLPDLTQVRTDDGNDERHGARLRRNHGRLHRVRN